MLDYLEYLYDIISVETYYHKNNSESFEKYANEMKDIFQKVFLNVYDIILNNNINYKNIYSKTFDYYFIKKITKDILKNDNYTKNILDDFNGKKKLSDEELGFSIIHNIYSTNYTDGIIYDIYINKHNYTDGLYNSIIYIHSIFDNYIKNGCKKRGFVISLYLSSFLVSILCLLRNIKKFVNNEELMIIFNNLKSQNNTVEYITDKIYPIYINFYKDIFTDEFNKNTFSILIDGVNNCIDNKLIKITPLYIDEIEVFKVDRDFDNLINSIENKFFFNHFNLYEETKYIKLFNFIIIKSGEYIDKDDFLNIISNKAFYIKKLKNKDKLKSIIEEKNRLLGEIKTDKVIKLSLNDVCNGVDFEGFLEKLYFKLGYNVVLTKSSGDQGADLVVEKNNQKTVIQAKFYSDTVGNKVIQEVVASKAYYKADKCVVVTNNYFTKSAIELASVNDVILIDGTELDNIIRVANYM
ncbi:restriction endonuclease [Clostridioides sp. ZZV14-6009]|uniref:restriction endonuclease n=1 Tax=Clostridioides sp. ZZV14-6009 TaxID=2811487 RepID=UPI001D11EBC4|nr:restriction endonuclease [Clostridioides sp. ZZV14-6009]